MPPHLEPEVAVVRPHVAIGPAGERTLLEAAVGDLLSRTDAAHVWLIGPAGSGKRTALQHLAAVFRGEPDLQLVDGADPPTPRARVVVQSAPHAPDSAALHWSLTPWTDGDCLAYLRSQHAPHTDAAIAAWRHPAPIGDLRRWPELCRQTLDHLAHVAATSPRQQEIASDPICALAFVLAGRLGQRRAVAAGHALRTFTPPHARAAGDAVPALALEEGPLLRSTSVRALLAAEELLRMVVEDEAAPFPPRAWPELLTETVAHLLHADPTLMHRLVALAGRPRRRPALLLSALCAAVPGFRPPHSRWRELAGARLCGIDLSGATLVRARLDEALLRDGRIDDADCREASAVRLQADSVRADRLRADRIDLTEASLRHASLEAAHLEGAAMVRADLSGAALPQADLRRSNLEGARLAGTDLSGARLDGADLAGVDLRTAQLRGASLTRTRLHAANLAGLALGDLVATGADFSLADLRATELRGADLRRAMFAGTMLAEVDLEGADLRSADLRGASFGRGDHPPGARPASLRACDLRGANLDGVDLSGVDLRGARIDPEHRQQARRWQAVLDPE